MEIKTKDKTKKGDSLQTVADATLEARLRQDRTCRGDFSYKQQEQDEFITPR